MSVKIALFATSILVVITAACAPKPSPDVQIQLAVAQTVAAVPTYTPYPRPVLVPTATTMSLDGLFCEYQFCIGHPVDVVFVDVNAQRNPLAPSSISEGIIAAYSPSGRFIQVMWQDATGASDAQFMFDVIITPNTDSKNGNPAPAQIANVKIFYVPITTAASTLFAYGGAAAWMCGGRAFAWKTYTPQPELAKNLLEEALQKFRCNAQ